MKRIAVVTLALVGGIAAQADFSYTQTRSTTGGMMAAMAGRGGPQSSKVSFKGQKMRTDDANTSVIMDLDAQTVTTLNNAQKTYTVRNFSDLTGAASDLNAKAEVKETGQKKTVNGFDAREVLMTLEMETAQIGKAQMEVDMWMSSAVPGAEQLHAFYVKNGDKLPWRALAGGGNPQMAAAMADLQKKIATMNGAPVQQIVRIKAPDAMAGRGGAPAGPSAAQMSQMSAGMEKARRQLEAMVAQGGPAAAIAKQQLDRMGPAPGAAPAASGGSSSWLIEMTIDSSGFSSADIPDSAFAIPAGYTKN